MKNQIKVIVAILLSVFLLTACGESASSIKLPMDLKFGDSVETVYNAMLEVGEPYHGDDTRPIHMLSVYDYSYLGYEWEVYCFVDEENGMFHMQLVNNESIDDYSVVLDEFKKEYGEPDKSETNEEQWHKGKAEISCKFSPKNNDNYLDVVSLYFSCDF